MSEFLISEPITVALPAVMDLKAAGPLAENLAGFRGMPLNLDASGVEKVGAQCVQILMSVAATSKDDMAPIALVDPSPQFRTGLALLGLTPEAVMEKEITR